MEAGLPNITGTVGLVVKDIQTDAFYSVREGTRPGGETNPYYRAQMDASRSNSIYGNSDTVTPESLSTKFFIKY